MTNEQMMDIYNRNAASVYRICYSYMKNVADAEDITQETFIKAFASDTKFKNETHERGWLILTASNLCKDNLKHWWHRNTSLEDFEEPVIEAENTSDETLEEIMKIPDKYKTVLFLFYYENFSTSEISRLIKKNDSTVRSLLSRGRKLLKERLEGESNE